GHHRIVDQFGGVQLVVQPAPGDPLLLGEQAFDLVGGALPGRSGLGGAVLRRRLRGSVARGLPRGLPVLDAREFDLVPAALLVPLLDTLEPAAGDTRNGKDQPPELPDVVHTTTLVGARTRVAEQGPRRRSSAPCPASSCSHRYGTPAVDRHPTPAVVLPRTTLSPRHEEAPGCHIRQLSPG